MKGNTKPKGTKGAAKIQRKVKETHRARKGRPCPHCGRRMARGVEDEHYGCGWKP